MNTSKEQIVAFLRGIIIISYLVYAPYYLYWRLGTFNPDALLFSWLIWGAEVFGYVTALLHVFMVNRLTSPEVPSPPEGYKVDVFVTACNESPSLLGHTLRAAIQMDYPHQTWLLDDGDNPEMEALAKELGCRYLARKTKKDAKAGNLNNALGHSTADFIAVFDADHVPNKDFLNRTLGFFRDENVAFVQTPQDFYNLDSYQHRRHKRLSYIWTEQSLFFRIIQRGKDRWNAAFFCGSCAVLRTSALKKIGGFATETVTEDLHTSIRIHKLGYKSVYISESLAYGLAPDSVDTFLSQRLRWGQGAIQVWRKEGILFSRGLTFAQRLNYFASVLTYFDGWPKAIFYVSPIIVLTTGIMPIHVLGAEFLVHFIPFYILCFWAYEEAGRGFGRTLLTEQYNMARFAVFLRATIGGFRKHIRFSVTPKQAYDYDSDERRFVLPQMAIFGASVAAILIGIILWYSVAHLTPMALMANLIWASINLGLAGAVVRFSMHKKHRRHDYRFPIPLPVQINSGNDTVFALAEDLSPNGCKIISETPLRDDNEPIAGRLFLPFGELPFKGVIKRHGENGATPVVVSTSASTRPSRKKLEYGLIFTLVSPGDAVQLENFLYGSDLQWQILDLHEDITTPISWLADLVTGDYPEKRQSNLSPKEWLPVIYHDTNGGKRHEQFAAISRTDWENFPAKLLLFEHIKARSHIELNVFGLKGPGKLMAQVTDVRRLETPAMTPLYIARLALSPKAARFGNEARSVLRSSTTASLLVFFISLGVISINLISTPVWARDWIGLAGAEAAEDNTAYAYVGAVLPLGKKSVLGNGWVQRYWLDWLEYRFESDNNLIQAEAPGASAALGYQGTKAQWQLAGYAGLGFRDTRLSPDKPDASARDEQTALILLGEADRNFAKEWRFNGIVNFAFDPDSYWSRARLLRRTKSGKTWQGVEVILQGDPDYDGGKLGYVLANLQAGKNVSMTLKFGASKIQGLNTEAYAGIEFARTFSTQ